MKKALSIVLVVVFLLFALVGCAAAPATQDEGSYQSMPEEAPAAPASSAAGREDASVKDPSKASSGLGDMEILSPLENTSQKLVYNANYTLDTYAFTDDYNKIVAAVKEAKGYISNEKMSGNQPEEYGDAGRTVTMQIRIPVDQYEAFADKLNGIGEIVDKQLSTEDITKNYYDTEARIEMLQERYNKLDEYLKKATKMEDIISLETEMSQILYDLDTLKGDKRYMDNLVQYSTFNITMTEKVKAEDVTVSKEGVGERASNAFNGSLKAVGVFFEEFAVIFVGAVPILVVLGASAGVVLLVVYVVKTIRKKPKNQ